MGTVIERRRKDGSVGYSAQILIKRNGKIAHRESRVFRRRPVALAWIEKREHELSKPGALESLKADDPTLAEAIGKYERERLRGIGQTAMNCLKAIKARPIGEKRCSAITSVDVVDLARELSKGRTAATVGNYMAHLSPVFRLTRPAFGYPLDEKAMSDAQVVMKELGLIEPSEERDRRPTIEELDKLLSHFQRRRDDAMPLHKIILFAIFSTRRLGEIVRIGRADLDKAAGRVLIRGMKHPRKKKGNDVWCNLPPEAFEVIESMPKGDVFFPFRSTSVSQTFGEACDLLDIDDLRFHDMRHEGISRLFEIGGNIPQVATVSGHRSWQSLKRYAQIRQTGDKYKNWNWRRYLEA